MREQKLVEGPRSFTSQPISTFCVEIKESCEARPKFGSACTISHGPIAMTTMRIVVNRAQTYCRLLEIIDCKIESGSMGGEEA